jgi:putative DNA primase/helicase
METKNTTEPKIKINGLEELKSLITNDINQLTDNIEVVENQTKDILQGLLKSIGKIDFQLLAFPESEKIQKNHTFIESFLLNGQLSDGY